LLFDDLLDWHNWFWSHRRLPPLGLICLGSDMVPGYPDSASNTMQGARYESGLDNSPMYDGELFNRGTHEMQLYDIGMTGLVIYETENLAKLAQIIGRPEQTLLVSRAKALRQLTADNLWDAKNNIFSNKYSNDTFYSRISPTSFYSLLGTVATDDQAQAQVTAWLLDKTRFCISLTWPEGVDDSCYWGLPSINAQDPAYPALGYWRGFVWGPMAQLTYWSLQNYDHISAVQTARKALCKQMTAMMMNQWNLHRHICENFNPHKDGDECTGTKFYHWGGLAGLISLIEEGLWQ